MLDNTSEKVNQLTCEEHYLLEWHSLLTIVLLHHDHHYNYFNYTNGKEQANCMDIHGILYRIHDRPPPLYIP